MPSSRPAVVLASRSPRRRALLEALGIELDVRASDVEEHFEGAPGEMVMSNARAKRDDVARTVARDAVVIAADTLVFLNGRPLGKPEDLDAAARMLRTLAGRTHEVLTGLAVAAPESGAAVEGYERTLVTFRELSDREIEVFVHAVQPLDRAGAYTVDGPGSLLVERYEGCYQNVLGLPLVRLDRLLRKLGISLFAMVNRDRAVFL